MLPIFYTPNFIDRPNDILLSLQKNLQWERRGDTPRCEYYCNDHDLPYVYGKGKGRREYLPRPYTPEILLIRKQLEAATNTIYEVCFLNRYLNQSDQLGWHADDSPEMDPKRPIATISLGVEREIWFRPIDSIRPILNEGITKLKLENGSLCLMLAGMQQTHQHRIPKHTFQCGERISLTFRGYVLK